MQAVVYALVIVFGWSTWTAVNGLWVELPLIVFQLPEQWTLPSYLTIIAQLGCVGPLIYGILDKFVDDFADRFRNIIIVGLLVAEMVGKSILIFVWKRTASIGGYDHSVALFLINFISALSDCTSNVACLPYMGQLKRTYIVAFYIGMGFSGVIPSLLALIQGVGDVQCIQNGNGTIVPAYKPAAFSFEVYNVLIVLTLLSSLVAFLVLEKSNITKSDRIDRYLTFHDLDPLDTPHTLTAAEFSIFLILTAWASALMNGILPAIQTYSCLPYGQQAYHFAITLSSLANPIACFIPFFVKVTRMRIIIPLTVLTTVLAAYCIATAAMSPQPPLAGTVGGSAHIVIMWILSQGALAYIRTQAAHILHGDSRPRALFWLGAFTQVGSFVGAVIMFPLVNSYKLFKSSDVC